MQKTFLSLMLASATGFSTICCLNFATSHASEEINESIATQSSDAAEGFEVTFATGDNNSRLAPNFSPKGTQFQLTPADLSPLPGDDHLVGKIQLGPDGAIPEGITISFSRSQKGLPYDQLIVDSNLDGDLTDESVTKIQPRLTRGKWWSSFGDITLQIPHSSNAEHKIDYPVSFWIVTETEDETPQVARFTRRGFLQGTFTKDNLTYNVVMTDGNNDAVFDHSDFWAISKAIDDGQPERPIWRNTTDFSWSGGTAWKIALKGTDGKSAVVSAFDPGITQQEDEESRDRYRQDRLAVRAETPITFESDYEAVIEKSRQTGQPCFIKFEATWCGPCKLMDSYVYTAQDVTESSKGILCIKVDGDVREDLKEKYEVASFPTGIFLDSEQNEVSRFSGYRTVKKMSELFQNVPR